MKRYDMRWAERVRSHGWELGQLPEEGDIRELKQSSPSSAPSSVYLSCSYSLFPAKSICSFHLAIHSDVHQIFIKLQDVLGTVLDTRTQR